MKEATTTLITTKQALRGLGDIIKRQSESIEIKDVEILRLKAKSATLMGELGKASREITKLNAENSAFDKAISGYFMWLGAKIREGTLIDPELAKEELRNRMTLKTE
jgi:hypothetical protein